MVRELFEMARTKKACIIFFDEIDAIGGNNCCIFKVMQLICTSVEEFILFLLNIDTGTEIDTPSPTPRTFFLKILAFKVINYSCSGTRFDDGAGGDNEVQRTMLELINQLDGFDPRGNIKVLMATNR